MDNRTLLTQIFPRMTHFGCDDTEVNGLSKDTYPENCEILMSGQERRVHSRREWFLVKVDGVFLFLRICTAAPGCGYDEFAVLHEVAVTEDAQQRLQAYAAEKIKLICEPRSVH